MALPSTRGDYEAIDPSFSISTQGDEEDERRHDSRSGGDHEHDDFDEEEDGFFLDDDSQDGEKTEFSRVEYTAFLLVGVAMLWAW
jgi:hypothetical protein